MNYFGHVVLAFHKAGGANEQNRAFAFGAMLPDLCNLAGLKLPRLEAGPLLDGVLFHQLTDSVFHGATTFTERNIGLRDALLAQGVRKGPARAAAHIAVEMLIDAALSRDETLVSAYLETLGHCSRLAPTELLLASSEHQLLAGLCAHLQAHGGAAFSTNRDHLEFRLGRTLAGRRLLEPTTAELRQIGGQVMAHVEPVRRELPGLLAELEPLIAPRSFPLDERRTSRSEASSPSVPSPVRD